MAGPASKWVQLYPEEIAARRNSGPPGALVVDCTNGGIGDVVMAAGCAQQLKRDHPNRSIFLACRPGEQQWARLLLKPERVIEFPFSDRLALRPIDTYDAELSEHWGASRWERYGAACRTTWSPPVVREVSDEAKWWAEKHRGAVVLVPYASHKNRAWEPSHWRALVQDLDDAGYYAVVIDDGRPGDDRRVRYPCPRLQDLDAERVVALMRAAHVIVSNDSGMASVGGALERRTIVLCGQQMGERIYGGYRSVEVIQGPAKCTGCHWRGQWGWHEVCDQLCAALNLIQPADVLRRIGPYSLLSGDRLDQLRRSVRATAQIGGAMAEVGVFRGGSAKEITLTDPVARPAPVRYLQGLAGRDTSRSVRSSARSGASVCQRRRAGRVPSGPVRPGPARRADSVLVRSPRRRPLRKHLPCPHLLRAEDDLGRSLAPRRPGPRTGRPPSAHRLRDRSSSNRDGPRPGPMDQAVEGSSPRSCNIFALPALPTYRSLGPPR